MFVASCAVNLATRSLVTFRIRRVMFIICGQTSVTETPINPIISLPISMRCVHLKPIFGMTPYESRHEVWFSQNYDDVTIDY